MAPEVRALADAHGGIWGEHDRFPHEDWVARVINDDTRLGYWEWVAARLEDDPDEAEQG